MSAVIHQLMHKEDLQSFLCTILDHMNAYFKTSELLSQNATYVKIWRITNKIQKGFPMQYSITSLSEKLINNVKEKIIDKYDQSLQKETRMNKNSGLKALFNSIDLNIEEDKETENIVQKDQQHNYNWVRKALLDEINLLREDIKENEDKIIVNLLKLINSKKQANKHILFMDSFLSNRKLLQKLKQYPIKQIVTQNDAKITQNQIPLYAISKQIKKSSFVLISADVVFKTGGILALSGATMLAIIAYQYKIPVIIITRGYCLNNSNNNKILLNQKQLFKHENPCKYFQIESNNPFKVYIAKKYDYIDRKYINLIITQDYCCSPQNLFQIFETYYNDI